MKKIVGLFLIISFLGGMLVMSGCFGGGGGGGLGAIFGAVLVIGLIASSGGAGAAVFAANIKERPNTAIFASQLPTSRYRVRIKVDGVNVKESTDLVIADDTTLNSLVGTFSVSVSRAAPQVSVEILPANSTTQEPFLKQYFVANAPDGQTINTSANVNAIETAKALSYDQWSFKDTKTIEDFKPVPANIAALAANIQAQLDSDLVSASSDFAWKPALTTEAKNIADATTPVATGNYAGALLGKWNGTNDNAYEITCFNNDLTFLTNIRDLQTGAITATQTGTFTDSGSAVTFNTLTSTIPGVDPGVYGPWQYAQSGTGLSIVHSSTSTHTYQKHQESYSGSLLGTWRKIDPANSPEIQTFRKDNFYRTDTGGGYLEATFVDSNGQVTFTVTSSNLGPIAGDVVGPYSYTKENGNLIINNGQSINTYEPAASKSISSISLSQTTGSVATNATFNLAAVVVTATYSDSSSNVVTGHTWSVKSGGGSISGSTYTSPTAAGTDVLTCTFTEKSVTKTADLAITVNALSISGMLQVTTIAGTASVNGSADGTGAEARFNFPCAIAADASGNLFVADYSNHTIRKITPAGGVTTIAGTAGVSGSADGTGDKARFNFPYGIAVDASGNLFVSDSNNSTIRKITAAGDVTTIAGTVGVIGSADGSGAEARFRGPWGIAVDASGNLFVADYFNSTIRKITAAGDVSTIAGKAEIIGSDDGPGDKARFRGPSGIAVDASGNLFVSESGNSTIRKITPAGVVTTIAGKPGVYGSADGTGADAEFYQISGIAIDVSGNLFVADSNNSTIRKITPAGVVTTIAGTAGFASSDNGTGAAARFDFPEAIAVDASGNIFVADANNHTIRKGVPVP